MDVKQDLMKARQVGEEITRFLGRKHWNQQFRRRNEASETKNISSISKKNVSTDARTMILKAAPWENHLQALHKVWNKDMFIGKKYIYPSNSLCNKHPLIGQIFV